MAHNLSCAYQQGLRLAQSGQSPDLANTDDVYFSLTWPGLHSVPFPMFSRGSCRPTEEFPKFSYKASSQPWISYVPVGAAALLGMVCPWGWNLYALTPSSIILAASPRALGEFMSGEFCGPTWLGPLLPLALCLNPLVLKFHTAEPTNNLQNLILLYSDRCSVPA